MSTLTNYEKVKKKTLCKCTCGGEMKQKIVFINGKLTKVSVCENCGRTELTDTRLKPGLFKTLKGNAS